MRWKLLQRRLSISAPQMAVRSTLPWPVRWAAISVVLGVSAAMGLWAFQRGKELAGLDRDAKQELETLRVEVATLLAEREKALSTANTAESLLTAERAAQNKLVQQLKAVENENQALKSDLGLFEKLLPGAGTGLQIRGFSAEQDAPGRLSYRLLVVQAGKTKGEFLGKAEILLAGVLDGKPWTSTFAPSAEAIRVKSYQRLEGQLEVPMQLVIKVLTARIVDVAGSIQATQTIKL